MVRQDTLSGPVRQLSPAISGSPTVLEPPKRNWLLPGIAIEVMHKFAALIWQQIKFGLRLNIRLSNHRYNPLPMTYKIHQR